MGINQFQNLPNMPQNPMANEQPTGMPSPAGMSVGSFFGGQGGSAQDGLQQIGQGASAVNQAISQAGSALLGGNGYGQSAPTLAQPVQAAYKKGGKVKAFAKGGVVSSASKRADGIATKGKTRCKIC
jgi:hypothetical protein